MITFEQVSCKTLLLKTIRKGIAKRLKDYNLDMLDIKIDDYVNHISNEIVLQIYYDLVYEDLTPIIVKYHASWWEYFKDEWFPKWLINKYPIKYYEKKINAKCFYPTLKDRDHKGYVEIFYQD